MKIVIEAVRDAFGDFRFLLILYAVCLVGLMVLFRGKRKAFVFPAILITIVVVNPIFYRVWAKLNEAMVYWRTLWMVPLLPVCAAGIALAVDKTRKPAIKAMVIAAGSAVIIFCGSFLYTSAYPPYTFGRAANSEKLPKDVVNVGQALLEVEEEPYVVTDSALSVYLRQYSGKIHSPYSRSVTYGTPGQPGRDMYAALTAEDYTSLARMMANYDYQYLVTNNWEEGKEEIIKAAGFEPVRQVNGYEIYRNHGQRTELRTYNDLHQVTEITYVNEKGEAVNGSNGYASVEYEYDDNGRIAYEFHRDAKGNPVEDSSGRAGYWREWNYLGQIVSETFLNAEGNPVEDSLGHAGYRREWNSLGQIVSETFLNAEGEPAAGPFATRICEYDRNHWLVREFYFDGDNHPMLRTDTGYATIWYIRDSVGNVVEERTYDTEGKLIPRSAGYSIVKRTFKTNPQTVTLTYFDETEQPINIGFGYQKRINEYTTDGKLSLTWFYDDKGNRLNYGSSCFHEFLQSLSRQNHLIFVSVKDEGTGALTETLLLDLQAIGIDTDLNGKYRDSYYAIITPMETREEISSDREVSSDGEIYGIHYSIASAGYLVGNKSSIEIDGTEYSKNVRGMNIVVYDLGKKEVTESISFDTCDVEMRVTGP